MRDVNGREYVPPYFAARYNEKNSDGGIVPVLFRLVPGLPTNLPSVDDMVNLTVGTQIPGYSGETFSIKKIGTSWFSDTPAATVVAQGDTVFVDVVDGTVRLAPTVYIPPKQLMGTNPNAILCEPGQGWIYRGAWLINPPVNLLKNPIEFNDNKPTDYPYDTITSVKNEGVGNLPLRVICDQSNKSYN